MPPRARSNFDYTQTAIGDCGHVTEAWPVIGSYKDGKRADYVFCDTCTRAKYGLNTDETLQVYVRVVEKKPRGTVEKELTGDAPNRPPRKTTPKKAAPKKPNPWEQLVSTKDVSEIP